MTELTEFLTARLDEREAVAKAATGAPWEEFNGSILSKAGGLTTVAETHNLEVTGIEGYTYPPDEQQLADARHIAGNDPAFVLADIAAKRRIIEDCEDWTNAGQYPDYASGHSA